MKVDSESLTKFAGGDEPVFATPWEAKVFAMTVSLYDQKNFTWAEWSQYLSNEVKENDQQTGDLQVTYYEVWLRALEKLLADKQIINADQSM